MKITRLLRIWGDVQGVFFRESMCRKARKLDITGWVRNRADGSVEAVVQGTPEAVAAILEWSRTGPEMARVEHVEVTEGQGDYGSFEKRPSV
jgi:acylphosphatase